MFIKQLESDQRTEIRRPLGEPAPAAANLALAVVILVVIILQTAFNAWQGKSLIMRGPKCMLSLSI